MSAGEQRCVSPRLKLPGRHDAPDEALPSTSSKPAIQSDSETDPGMQDNVHYDANESDSGDSLFITQKDVLEVERRKRRRCFSLRSELSPTSGGEEDVSEPSPSTFQPCSRSDKRSPKNYKLPKFYFPFLAEAERRAHKSVRRKRKPGELTAKKNKSLHYYAMGGFFRCVRAMQLGDEAGDDVNMPDRFVDEGWEIPPLSEEEDEIEEEDVKVVPNHFLLVASKTKRRQPWYTPPTADTVESNQGEQQTRLGEGRVRQRTGHYRGSRKTTDTGEASQERGEEEGDDDRDAPTSLLFQSAVDSSAEERTNSREGARQEGEGDDDERFSSLEEQEFFHSGVSVDEWMGPSSSQGSYSIRHPTETSQKSDQEGDDSDDGLATFVDQRLFDCRVELVRIEIGRRGEDEGEGEEDAEEHPKVSISGQGASDGRQEANNELRSPAEGPELSPLNDNVEIQKKKKKKKKRKKEECVVVAEEQLELAEPEFGSESHPGLTGCLEDGIALEETSEPTSVRDAGSCDDVMQPRKKPKRRKKRKLSLRGAAHTGEEMDNVDVTPRVNDDVAFGERVKKKKKKRRKRQEREEETCVNLVPEEVVAQADESVSAQEREKEWTTSGFAADCAEKKAASHRSECIYAQSGEKDIHARDAELAEMEPEGRVKDRVKKKKKRKVESLEAEGSGVEELSRILLLDSTPAPELSETAEGVKRMKKKKRKKKMRREGDATVEEQISLAHHDQSEEVLECIVKEKGDDVAPPNEAIADEDEPLAKKKKKKKHSRETIETSEGRSPPLVEMSVDKHRKGKRKLYNPSVDYMDF